MKPLYSQFEFEKATSRSLLPFNCQLCGKIFCCEKHTIQAAIKGNASYKIKFCSSNCADRAKYKQVTVNCKNCSKLFSKLPSDIKKSKSKNYFCSSSCAATYNNAHKTKGYRRSKLEVWLEIQLTKLYPNLKILYNSKEAINAELDIYIPSLSLAFELNGIFHYEPIYGKNELDKIHSLARIQNNDKRKFQACIENNIELCIIDTLRKRFNEENSQQFLKIITSIINKKL